MTDLMPPFAPILAAPAEVAFPARLAPPPLHTWRGAVGLLLFAIAAVLLGPRPAGPGVGPTPFAAATSYAADALRHGRVPLWNPYAGLGEPFLGNGTAAVFHPAILLHVLLSPTYAWPISAALGLWLAGLGVWFIARRCGLEGGPRFLAGMAFMLGGFSLTTMNTPASWAFTFLPLLAVAVDRLADRPTLPRTAVAALAVAAVVFAGDPLASLQVLLIVAGVYLLRLAWLRPGPSWRALPAVVAAAVVGLALAGVQWMPWMDNAANAVFEGGREGGTRGIGWAGALFPYAAGFGAADDAWSASREIAAGWIGTLPLVLALLGLRVGWGNRSCRAWAIVGLVAACLAAFPPVSSFPGPAAGHAHWLAAAALALALLSGFGLARLLERMRRPDLGPTALALGHGLLVLAGLLAVTAVIAATLFSATHAPPARRAAALRLLLPAGLLALSAGLLWWRGRQPHSLVVRSHWTWLLLVSVELLAFASAAGHAVPAERVPGAWADVQSLREKFAESPQSPYRVGSVGDALPPQLALAARVEGLRPAGPLVPRRLADWTAAVGASPRLDSTADALDPALDLLNAREWVVPAGEAAEGTPDGWRTVQRTAAFPRVWSAARPQWVPTPQEAARLAGLSQRVTEAVRVTHLRGFSRIAANRLLRAFTFDPRDLVLIDSRVPELTAQWAKEDKLAGVQGYRNAAPPAVEYAADSTPDSLHLKITGGNSGWLVLANAWAEGWTARIEQRRVGSPPRMVPKIVLPAYGLLQTIPLAEMRAGFRGPRDDSRPLDVWVEYKPMAFKDGLFLTIGGAVMLVLLLGGAMLRQPVARVEARET